MAEWDNSEEWTVVLIHEHSPIYLNGKHAGVLWRETGAVWLFDTEEEARAAFPVFLSHPHDHPYGEHDAIHSTEYDEVD